MSSDWDRARAVADAVLYEGYLLYPYRGTSSKNQSRWQFGVLGPQGAADAGLGEDDSLAAEFLVDGAAALTEAPAICLYLADRYGCGALAPRADEPERGQGARHPKGPPGGSRRGAAGPIRCRPARRASTARDRR